jgi:hypothetical protein
MSEIFTQYLPPPLMMEEGRGGVDKNKFCPPSPLSPPTRGGDTFGVLGKGIEGGFCLNLFQHPLDPHGGFHQGRLGILSAIEDI